MVLGKKKILSIIGTIVLAVLVLIITPLWEDYTKERFNISKVEKMLRDGEREEFIKYREKFNDEIILSRVNASGQNLRGIDLSQSSIFVSDFTNAILIDANMKGITFSGDMIGADLSNVILNKATLKRINGAGINLTDAILDNANLSKAILNAANLSGAYLNAANLSGAYLSNANLSGAYLNAANLTGANFDYANLSGAYLRFANLSGAYLYDANLSGANLNAANLSGAYLYGTNLTGADLRFANLTGADLRNAILDCNNHPICN